MVRPVDRVLKDSLSARFSTCHLSVPMVRPVDRVLKE